MTHVCQNKFIVKSNDRKVLEEIVELIRDFDNIVSIPEDFYNQEDEDEIMDGNKKIIHGIDFNILNYFVYKIMNNHMTSGISLIDWLQTKDFLDDLADQSYYHNWVKTQDIIDRVSNSIGSQYINSDRVESVLELSLRGLLNRINDEFGTNFTEHVKLVEIQDFMLSNKRYFRRNIDGFDELRRSIDAYHLYEIGTIEEWLRNNWGCQANPYPESIRYLITEEEHNPFKYRLRLEFDTEWDAPVGVMIELFKRFPECEFSTYYLELANPFAGHLHSDAGTIDYLARHYEDSAMIYEIATEIFEYDEEMLYMLDF